MWQTKLKKWKKKWGYLSIIQVSFLSYGPLIVKSNTFLLVYSDIRSDVLSHST